MGLVFEELIRNFAKSSNETAGKHFILRDIVRLTTSPVFMEDDEALTKGGIIRTIDALSAFESIHAVFTKYEGKGLGEVNSNYARSP